MTTKSDGSDDEPRVRTWPMWVAASLATILVVAYVAWFAVTLRKPPAEDPALWGQFGDFVGGILNPLVAMLALLMLVQGVALQRETLRVTRRELQDTRDVMRRQQFDSVFSAVMAMLSSLITAPGLWEDIWKAYQFCVYTTRNVQDMEERSRKLAQALLDRQRMIGPYMNLVASAAGLILSEKLPEDARCRYFEVLRALVPSHCAYLIFLQLIHSPSNADLVRAVKEYQLLAGLPKEERSQLLEMAHKLNLHGVRDFPQ